MESGIRLSQPDACPASVWNSVKSCWKDNPKSRPSFQQLKNSLYQNEHFPKVLDKSRNDNVDIEVQKAYTGILEDDLSMRTKYNDICERNKRYLSKFCNKQNNETCPEAIIHKAPKNFALADDQTEVTPDIGLEVPSQLGKEIWLADEKTSTDDFQGHTRDIDVTSLKPTYETPVIDLKLSKRYTSSIQAGINEDVCTSGIIDLGGTGKGKNPEDADRAEAYKLLRRGTETSQSTNYTTIDTSETIEYTEKKYRQKGSTDLVRIQNLNEATEF